MKPCIICKLKQPLSEYYVHKAMGDGHLNKCKTCCKKQNKEREEKLRNSPEWVEKEQSRHRDKYHRLGYKEKHKPTFIQKKETIDRYNKKYPEKRKAKQACQHLAIKGLELHHWSYNQQDWKDIIPLDNKTHRAFHRYLKYDSQLFVYRNKEGVLLNTKEKHLEYFNKIKNSF